LGQVDRVLEEETYALNSLESVSEGRDPSLIARGVKSSCDELV